MVPGSSSYSQAQYLGATKMDCFLQFGYGMKGLSTSLIEKWQGGTVILSPRDSTPSQLLSIAKEVTKVGGKTLFDPQLYYPRANHPRLAEYDYWPNDYNTGVLFDQPSLNNILQKIHGINNAAQTEKYIIPGIYCARVNEDWYAIHDTIHAQAEDVFSDKKRLSTICLSGEVLRFEEQIEDLLSRTEDWDTDGYYVIAEHPKSQYLVEDPLWLAHLLILCSGLKLQGREVIVGYGHHQLLCLAAAHVDALASGNWINVRSFSSSKFHERVNETVSQRSVWYYCPHALSEYQPNFLDMGYRAGILDELRPDLCLGSDYADILFSGALPSSTTYSESQAFKHYLHCLHQQCLQATRASFQETFNVQEVQLETAEQFIKRFHEHGVRGRARDFANFIDVNRSALSALQDARGFVLEREWE